MLSVALGRYGTDKCVTVECILRLYLAFTETGSHTPALSFIDIGLLVEEYVNTNDLSALYDI